MSRVGVAVLKATASLSFSPVLTLAAVPVDGGCKQAHLRIMPKRKTPELTPAEQYKRFKEAAKAAGVTKSEEEFERAFKRVAPRKPTRKSVSK